MNTQIFNSIARIFFLFIFLLLLQGNATLEAQTRTFRGTESNLWDNPFNWEPFGLLPTAAEDVVIDPTGPHTNVEMNIDVDIQSLEVKSGTLTVPGGKTLTISNSVEGLNGIKVFTSLTNEGTIYVQNTGGAGVLASGAFHNKTQLLIGQGGGSIGMNGFDIQGAGGSLNNDGGTIYIDNTGTQSGTLEKHGLNNDGGSLINQNLGEFYIGQNEGIAGKGMVGNGGGTSFTNDASIIRIDNTGTNDPSSSSSAIWLVNAAMFENKGGGHILIGQISGNIGRDGITMLGSCAFKNTNGTVTIDNTGFNAGPFGFGVSMSSSSFFLNQAAGQLLIGQNDGNIKESGISMFNANAAFINNGGMVRIDNTGVNSVNSSIGAIISGGPGAQQFTNKNDGQVLLGQINGNANGIAFNNFGVVSNEGCHSLIHIFSDDVIITNDGKSFLNEGVIIENASGNSNITTNNGIVQNLNGGTFTVESGNPAVNNGSTYIWQGCVSSDWTSTDNWFLGGCAGQWSRGGYFEFAQ